MNSSFQRVLNSLQFKIRTLKRKEKERWDYYKISGLEAGEIEENVEERIEESFLDKLKLKKSWNFAKEGMRITAFSLLLFTIGFFTINAEAYSEITMAWLTEFSGAEQVSQLERFLDEEEMPEQKIITVVNEPEEQKLQLPELALEVTPPDYRLIIPKIDKNIPVIQSNPQNLVNADWKSLEKTFQEDLRNGVIHYPGTANPGENGNVFITGHSSYYLWDSGRYKNVFARLNQVEVGDDLVVYYGQEKYQYKVREIKEVKSDDISVLAQSENEKILTIMTCTPVGTNIRRLVVIAEQVE